MVKVCKHLRLCRGCSSCRSSLCWPNTAGRRRKRRPVDLGPNILRGDCTIQKMGSITGRLRINYFPSKSDFEYKK